MLWAFSLAMLALIASPGPDFFFVLSRGASLGPRAGLLAAAGIAIGLCAHTSLAVLGLSALLRIPWLFATVKVAGAAYLFWIGLQMLRTSTSRTPSPSGASASTPGGPVVRAAVDGRAVLRQGIATNVLNPKAALTFAAFLPQWVSTERGSVAMQFAVLGAVTIGLALAWFCVVGLGAARLGAWLARRPRLEAWASRATGALLIGCGLVLATQTL
jgi:threonine/homoserine/homoserine lactone efflux protein